MNQDTPPWSFRQSVEACLEINISRAEQVLKHPYTPLVEVNQELCAWSFRQFSFSKEMLQCKYT